MKIIPTMFVFMVLFVLPATTCFALPSGHSHHFCSPNSKITHGSKSYHVGYNANGQVVCTDGPSKGSVAR